jgi:hypothetical protein
MSKRKQSTPRPPRTRNRFREREAARITRAAKKGGAVRVEIDPETGRYLVILKEEIVETKDTPERIISKL